MYEQTKNPSNPETAVHITAILNAATLYNIDWYQTTWDDLRKPLYSAIATFLYMFDQVCKIPDTKTFVNVNLINFKLALCLVQYSLHEISHLGLHSYFYHMQCSSDFYLHVISENSRKLCLPI